MADDQESGVRFGKRHPIINEYHPASATTEMRFATGPGAGFYSEAQRANLAVDVDLCADEEREYWIKHQPTTERELGALGPNDIDCQSN